MLVSFHAEGNGSRSLPGRLVVASCIRSDEQNGARIRSASRVLPGNNGSGTAWVGLVGRPSFLGPKPPMFCAPGDLPWRAINRDTTKSRADLLGHLKLPFVKTFCPARVLTAFFDRHSSAAYAVDPFEEDVAEYRGVRRGSFVLSCENHF
jgi:hypothetical protein